MRKISRQGHIMFSVVDDTTAVSMYENLCFGRTPVTRVSSETCLLGRIMREQARW